MKQGISTRYESYDKGRLAIDVSVGRIEELFEDFDSAASYVKKDLDQDFVEYLIECVREIRKKNFVIRINLPHQVQIAFRDRVRKSIKNYFSYLELLERRKLQKMIWKSFLLFCLGMFLLAVTMPLHGSVKHFSGVLQDLLSEGLTVAAWVSLWSAFANLIFGLPEIFTEIRIARRICNSEVVFREQASAAPTASGTILDLAVQGQGH